MNKLTKRERLLLQALIVVAILAGGIKFLVMPAADRYFEASEELVAQQAAAEEITRRMEGLAQTEREIQSLSSEVGRYKAMLYPYMMNEELDRKITTMISGFTPISVQIETETPAEIPAYGIPETGDKPVLILNTATVTMTGSITEFMDLADEISRNTSMRMTKFDIKRNGSSDNYTFVFVLVSYMNDIEG